MDKRNTALTAEINTGDTITIAKYHGKGFRTKHVYYTLVTCTVTRITEKAICLNNGKSEYHKVTEVQVTRILKNEVKMNSEGMIRRGFYKMTADEYGFFHYGK